MASRKAEMPSTARRSGLEALRGVLRRRNPGFDVVFEVEGADLVDDPATGKVSGPLAAPEDASPLIDRIDVATTASGATDEDAVDETAKNLPPLPEGKV